MILKMFNTGVLQVNTYVLIDETTKEAIIIDMGGNYQELQKYIDSEGGKLKFILNTHGHFDHIMGDKDVQTDKIKIPVYMHKDDFDFAKNIDKYVKAWDIVPSWTEIKIDKFIDEKSKLKIGNIPIKVFHTPGHTKGGVSFLIEDMLFSGDTLFNCEIGRTDLPGGDYDSIINSIKTKLMPLPDETKVYPGHGAMSTIGEERKCNRYLQ